MTKAIRAIDIWHLLLLVQLARHFKHTEDKLLYIEKVAVESGSIRSEGEFVCMPPYIEDQP